MATRFPLVRCVAVLVMLARCSDARGDSCKAIGREEAVEVARVAKVGMLSRSLAAEQIEFRHDTPTEVLLRDNGYAAKVHFQGVSGRRLVALIHDDCVVGWTGS